MLKQNIPHAAQPPSPLLCLWLLGSPWWSLSLRSWAMGQGGDRQDPEWQRSHTAMKMWHLSSSWVTCGVGIPDLKPIPTVPRWDCGSVGVPGAVASNWAAAQAYSVVPAAHENLCPRGCHVSCLSLAHEFHRSPPAQELPPGRPFPSLRSCGVSGQHQLGGFYAEVPDVCGREVTGSEHGASDKRQLSPRPWWVVLRLRRVPSPPQSACSPCSL